MVANKPTLCASRTAPRLPILGRHRRLATILLIMTLSGTLVAQWQARAQFFEAGICPTENADPAGSLAEALCITVLSGKKGFSSGLAALARDRRTKEVNKMGPALGSHLHTQRGYRNAQGCDFVVPWETVLALGITTEVVKGLRDHRTALDKAYNTISKNPQNGYGKGDVSLARVQVKARLASDIYDNYVVKLDRKIVEGTRDSPLLGDFPTNDLFAVVVFNVRGCPKSNFVESAALFTRDFLLKHGGKGPRTAYVRVDQLREWISGNPRQGFADITKLCQAVRIPGW